MLKPIALILLCQLAGEAVAHGFGMPVPGPVIGLLLLFALLLATGSTGGGVLDASPDGALGGGDDYRLAFTLPPELLPSLRAQWPEASAIGRVRAGQGVQLLDAAGNEVAVSERGYNHFNP